MAFSRRVRIGLIGYGTWAQRVHIPSIKLSQSAVLTAVCGPDATRARQIALESGAELAAVHPDQVIRSPQVDAVLITSPNNAHATPHSRRRVRARLCFVRNRLRSVSPMHAA